MAHLLPPAEEIAALPPDGGPNYNRLIFESSPYLLLHADNPVNWYPWGSEALQRAREEDKPILLSLGYASCHWCHVMARESFENEEVARLLNSSFVAIKVDREERPDLDEIYMHASHLLTGGGGWPNNVWLTPALEPWYTVTYLPPDDTQGRPGFKTLLRVLAEMWAGRREEVEAQAHKVTSALWEVLRPRPAEQAVALDRRLVDRALKHLAGDFDDKHGGFGQAPKFPPHASLRLLLYEYARSGDPEQGRMITQTLDAMCLGGLRDHLGGGFHRYCLGTHWIVPHFEKTLYDNAQLLRAYTHAHLLTDRADYREVAQETADWALREMLVEGGGFASALDAESEGEEGKFYVWEQREILQVLGQEEGRLFCHAYDVQPQGNYRDEYSGERTGANVLHLNSDWRTLALRERLAEAELRRRLTESRQRLRIEREKRVAPARDDKVQAAGNGLMIGALAYAGRVLNEPRYTQVAERAAMFVLGNLTSPPQPPTPDARRERREAGEEHAEPYPPARVHAAEKRLYHTWRGGQARVGGFLDDYACLAEGLFDLYEATGEGRWLQEARALAEAILTHFPDVETGGLYFTPDDGEPLLLRTMRPYDDSTPSGNAVAAWLLLRLAQETGETRYRQAVERLLQGGAASMQASPRAAESLILAVAMWLEE